MNRLTMGLYCILAFAYTSTAVAGTVGGNVSGLKGSYVVLKNNNANPTILIANAAFKFSVPVRKGKPYLVTVAKQPLNQTCKLGNFKGVMGSSNVTNVLVTCATNKRKVGGSITGLIGAWFKKPLF